MNSSFFESMESRKMFSASFAGAGTDPVASAPLDAIEVGPTCVTPVGGTSSSPKLGGMPDRPAAAPAHHVGDVASTLDRN